MSDPPRRVAVTGAAGYVGRGLVDLLEKEESIERVLATDIRSPVKTYTSKVVFRQHDVTAPMADLLAEHEIETVVHLAFLLNSGHKRAAAEQVNVGGAVNILEACKQTGISHLVYLSSSTIYGAHPDNPALLSEESPIRPVKGFQYVEDKARVESLLAEHQESNPDLAVTVLRGCPVMGPTADNFISRAFSQPFLIAIRGWDPPMQFLHEDDQSEILRTCVLQGIPGVYNIGGDGGVKWTEMAAIFGRKLVHLPAPLIYGLTGMTWKLRLQSNSPACGLDFIRYSFMVSCDKIKRELGVTLRYSSEDAWNAFVTRRQE